ncbi:MULTISPECIES: transporter substrate-binding domain-containing protein [Pseudomonas]|uniref:transporter substrate-binding domain-containing protein n=1 Tax=Pseudomonas TaxID=286 RepID=UPI001BEA7E9B|nr:MULTISPECIES: transporter substrate-binding domain-containing protein [Pseudomonas]MBT2340940.1 transporter substrate-binding domain-containing protein [Pseudomonas fluorescens]MCD4532328.1 transporter substrate-binding domain-containing protein [Pseudomonas sp. C3-2018]
MLFFIKSKPMRSWVAGLALMSWAQWGGAAPLAVFETPLADPGERLVLDTQELKWIRENPRVVVASMRFPLYLFKNELGQWDGLNHDILQRIAQMTGLEFVHRESFSPGQLLTMLENGEADMTTNLAMNDERRDFLSFSHAFGGFGWVFVGRDGEAALHSLEQLKGKVLALPARHALEAEIRRDYPDIELRTVKTYGEARALVESREAYATIENETGVHLYPAGQLQVGTSLEGKWQPDYLAVRKDLAPLLGILNKALEVFPPNDMAALRSKWMPGVVPSPAPSFWQRVSRWGYGCVTVFVGFGLLSVLWNRRLQKQVDQRLTAETLLKDQLMLQRTLMDAIPDPIFIRDLEGRLVMCNKSYEDLLATRFEKLRGTRLTDVAVFAPSTAELLHGEVMEQLRTGQSRFADRQLLFSSGARDIYHWSVPFYGADGQLRGVLGGWNDSERRRCRSDRLPA